jgi:hypothetical protein
MSSLRELADRATRSSARVVSMRKGLTVAGSLIYLGTHAIAPGKLDIAKEVSRELGRSWKPTIHAYCTSGSTSMTPPKR